MLIFLILIFMVSNVFAVEINIDASAGRKAISPYIYGKNNSLSDDPNHPLSKADWQYLRDAGVKMFRENGSNNSTKYNWRRKLSSHPDWYNNVYSHDWDFAAQSLANNLSNVQGMWAFQLIGRVAASNNYNFNDWAYNNSQWWEGVRNNWAGGGGPEQGDGDPDLYLMDWNADSTVGIVDKWFGNNGLGLDKTMFQYWNMDNEPEVWHGTHDDVYPEAPPVEQYMQKYFDVAKKARAKFSDIKLVGPVATNEWQWYNWDNDKINDGGKSYTWLEYFIKRIAEEQNATGVRLLDVLDIHFYPYENQAADIVQLHRVWFDKTYNYPGANGVKRAGNMGWDNRITQEYIFERCRDWLNKHMGVDHGVTFCVSEMGIEGNNPNVTAVWYASTLGVFADEGVEIFTLWHWKIGMWEVLHLMSNYCKQIRVKSLSDLENTVSAYSSMNAATDSMTVILVNRDLTESQQVNVNISDFKNPLGDYTYLMLFDLPGQETFKSRSDNALKSGTVSIDKGSFNLILPALSVTAVIITGKGTGVSASETQQPLNFSLNVFPNPFNPTTTISYCIPQPMKVKIELYDIRGRFVQTLQDSQIRAGLHQHKLNGENLSSGVYFICLKAGTQIMKKKVLLLK